MLGDNIKKLRNEIGLTQNELILKAKELKENSSTFTQSQLSKWEKNETIPSDENIQLLSEIFNCSKEDLEKEDNDRVDYMQIYEDAFALGKNFKASEIKLLLYKATDSKKDIKDIAKYYSEFFIKNAMPVPKIFIDMLSRTKNDDKKEEVWSWLTAFNIGFWNGSYNKDEQV